MEVRTRCAGCRRRLTVPAGGPVPRTCGRAACVLKAEQPPDPGGSADPGPRRR